MSIFDAIKKPLSIAKDTVKGLPQATKELVTGTGEFSADKTLGIARNTIIGLPQATKETFLPTRGYTEEELKQSKPTLLETIKAPIKLGAEIGVSFGNIAGNVDQYIPKNPIQRLSETGVGGYLADIGQKIQDFSTPKTAGEAKAMRLTDIITAPIGIGKTKNIGTTFKAIAETEDLGIIARELRGLGLADDVVSDLAPRLKTVNNEKVVSDIISGTGFRDITDNLTSSIQKSGGKTFAQRLSKNLDPNIEIQKAQEFRDKIEKARLFGRTLKQDTQLTKQAKLRTELQQLDTTNNLTSFIQKAKASGQSFDEWVKGQTSKAFHGSDVANIIEKEGFKKMPVKTGVSAFGEGSYLTTRKSNAKGYGGVVDAYLPKDIKLKKVFDSDAYKVDTKKLIEEGYDGTVMETGNGQNIAIFDPSKIKTRSQLKAEWDKIGEIKPKKTVDEVDRLIAQGKIRVKRVDDRDVFQYEKSGKWVNARDSDSAVAQVNKKLFPKPKEEVVLPKELEEKKLALEFKKETLDNSPFAGDNKFMVDREGRVRELGDVKSPKLSRKIEDRMMSAGVDDPQEFSAGVEKYMKDKAELKKEIADVNKEVKLFKTQEKLKEPVIQESKKPSDQVPQLIDKSEGEVRSIEKVARESLSKAQDLNSDISFSSLEKIISQQTPLNKKVNWLDYIRTPDRVMEKIGLGEDVKYLRNQYEKYLQELPKNIEKITEWSKEIPKESNERIFKYLDGQAIDLNTAEKKVALEIKEWLKEWAERLDLPEDNRIAEYITHIFDKELLAKEFDEDLAKIITDKIPSEVYNPFLLRRLGAKGYVQDTWKALDAYVKRGTRKVYVDPAISKIADKASSFELSQWNFVKNYLDNVNMRPSDVDNLVDNSLKQVFGYYFGQRPTNVITRTLRQMTYRGMLGLNLSSALKNLSQGANTYAKLGEKYTALGYLSMLKSGAKEELLEQGVLRDAFIQDRTLSATKKLFEKLDKALFIFFDNAEKINRGSAYFGAKAKALAQGKTELEAIEYAKKIVRDTQFSFTPVDTPVALQGDIAKTLLQFQSYTTKQIEFLIEMAKNKEFSGLLRYALAGLVFSYTIGQAFGFDWKDTIPTLRFDTPASLKFPVETSKALLDSPDKYGRQRDLQTKLRDVGKSFIGNIPAGIQAKKTYEGMKAVIEGANIDRAGRSLFKVGGSLPKNTQAILFGKYASEEAKNYYSGKTTAEVMYEKLSKSQTPREDFQAIIDSSPELAKKILEIKKKKDLGFTDEDEKILKMGVENGQRAKKILDRLNDLETQEEKRQLYNDYIKKKIITDTVDKQIKEGLNKPKKDPLFKDVIKKLFLPKQADAAEISSYNNVNNKKAEDVGLISVPKKWNYAMEDVYMRYPELPKGIVETVLLMESSMGKDSRNRKRNLGEYGWIAGHTTTGRFKDLLDKASKDPKLEQKIKVFEKKNDGKYIIENIKNLGDEYSAIQATGSVLTSLIRNNPNIDPLELYFKKYVTAKESDTIKRRELFDKALSFYSSL